MFGKMGRSIVYPNPLFKHRSISWRTSNYCLNLNRQLLLYQEQLRVLYVHTPTHAAAILLYLKYPTRQQQPLSLCKTNMRTYTIAQ
jgi:hypothetical protein